MLCDAVSDVDLIFTNCTVDIYFWTSEHCLAIFIQYLGYIGEIIFSLQHYPVF